MDGTNGLKETTLSVNIFTAPGKAMVGGRPKPFGETLAFDPITSTLIFGAYDAVLVDAMTTVPEKVMRVLVDDHNRVKKGDVLVQLDKEPYQVKFASKKAILETAVTDLTAAEAKDWGLLSQVLMNLNISPSQAIWPRVV